MYNARYLQPQVSTKGLLAHWKMWDGFASSGKVFDYALNANLGTTTMISYGTYPGYLFIDGSQINCGSDSTLDNLFDSGGSFAGWLKPTGQGQGNAGRVFNKTNAALTAGVVLYCNASDTKLTFIQSTASTDGNWTFPIDITGDVWQRILVTYNASTAAGGGSPTAYVNGVAVVVTEVAAPDDARDSDAAVEMYIGQGSAGGKAWNGKMDDIMFFNRILTAQEAKSDFEVTRQKYGV